MPKHRPAFALSLALSMGITACASIWGFEDGALGPNDGGSTDGAPPPPDAPCALTCIAAPPSGWRGPYEISETNGETPVPAPQGCTGAYPGETYAGSASPSVPPTSCTCTCGSAAGGTCAAPVLTLYQGGSCMANHMCGAVDASTAVCLDFDKMCVGARMDLAPPAPVGGTCPVYTTATVPEAGWGARARLCAVDQPASGVCDAGETCTPPVGSPFESAYCIMTSQLTNCPVGPYSHPRVYYGGAADDRACSPCLCGPSSVTCAGGTVTTFMGMNCGLGPMPGSASQSCTDIGQVQSVLYNNDAVVTPGMCAPSGGLATGSFTPMTPTTICCTQ